MQFGVHHPLIHYIYHTKFSSEIRQKCRKDGQRQNNIPPPLAGIITSFKNFVRMHFKDVIFMHTKKIWFREFVLQAGLLYIL